MLGKQAQPPQDLWVLPGLLPVPWEVVSLWSYPSVLTITSLSGIPTPPPRPSPGPASSRSPARWYSRDANLKQIVLDELLAQHDDAELDAQLHQAAARGALQAEGGRVRSHPTPRA